MKPIFRNYLVLLVIASLIISLAFVEETLPDAVHISAKASVNSDLTENQTDTWTIMVYMVGSDLQTNFNAASADIQEMMAIGSRDKVNVVICTGGSKSEGWQEVMYSRVVQGNVETYQNLGQVDMAEPTTLGNFVIQAEANFPADKYVLILWNHGAGVNGYGNDENSQKDFSLNDLTQTLRRVYEQTQIKYEILGFDACLMATLEVASSMSDLANYLVASEELEAASGWNYTPILQSIVDGTATDGLELGQIIADGFLAQCKAYGFSGNTLSVVDLGAVDEIVIALEKLVTDPSLYNSTGFAEIAKGRSQAEAYGKEAKEPSNSYDGVDLLDFARHIRKQQSDLAPEADEVIKAVRKAVVYNVHDDTKPNASGLSIFLPYEKLVNDQMVEMAMANYEQIGFSPVYTEFLNQYVGRAVADQEDPEIPKEFVQQDGNLLMAVCTSNDVDEVYVVLIDATDAADGTIELLGVMLPDVMEYKEEGGVDIGHEWDATWIGINDYPAYISDIFVESYFDEESGTQGELIIIMIPAVLNDEDVILTYSVDEAGVYVLESIIPEVGEDGIYERRQIEIQPGDYISLLYEGYDLETDEQFWSEGDVMEIESEDDLVLTISSLDQGSYLLGFLITDFSRNETIVIGEEIYEVE